MDMKFKNVPEKSSSLKNKALPSRCDLFWEPFLDIFRHIGSYIPKLTFTHMPVHNPQDSPYNFSRVYIVIKLKLCVNPSCKFLFFEFLGLIPESPAIKVHPFNYKGQLCCQIDCFFCRKPVPERMKCTPQCLICTFFTLPPQLA